MLTATLDYSSLIVHVGIMATNAPGTQARKAPPAPSTRTLASRQPSVRPARRNTNWPPAKPGQARATITRVHETPRASSVVTSAAVSSESKSKSAPAVTTALRDELVRALMPDLQVLTRHTVDTAVARATAPLLDQLRELQAELRDLRSAQARPEPATSPRRAPEIATPTRAAQAEAPSPTRPLATVASPAAIAVQRPPVSAQTQAVPDVAYDVDIPMELNGMRRKKAVAWVVGVVVTMLLLSAAGISILSNVGTHL
jgi:hypothetical protein